MSPMVTVTEEILIGKLHLLCGDLSLNEGAFQNY